MQRVSSDWQVELVACFRKLVMVPVRVCFCCSYFSVEEVGVCAGEWFRAVLCLFGVLM